QVVVRANRDNTSTDRGAPRVGVDAGKHQRAHAGFAQAAQSRYYAAQAQRPGVGLEGAAVAIKSDRTTAAEPCRGFQRAAIEGQRAGRSAQVVVRANRDNTSTDRG